MDMIIKVSYGLFPTDINDIRVRIVNTTVFSGMQLISHAITYAVTLGMEK